MSSVTPLKLVDSVWDDSEGQYINHRWTGNPGTEGHGKYYSRQGSDVPAGLLFICPGCREMCSIAFVKYDNHPVWSWDGNRESPTCTPSILHSKHKGGCNWHGYLTAGIFKGWMDP